jgi:hypothetical protein
LFKGAGERYRVFESVWERECVFEREREILRELERVLERESERERV